jgi:hypothetical protein
MDITTPIEVRAKLYSELAQYIPPKRKAIERTGESTGIGAQHTAVGLGTASLPYLEPATGTTNAVVNCLSQNVSPTPDRSRPISAMVRPVNRSQERTFRTV